MKKKKKSLDEAFNTHKKFVTSVKFVLKTECHRFNVFELISSSIFIVLRFNSPVNKFSVMSGRSHRFLGIKKFSEELIA